MFASELTDGPDLRHFFALAIAHAHHRRQRLIDGILYRVFHVV